MKEEEEARRPEYTPITGRMPVTVLPVCALQGLSLIQNQVLPLDTIEVLEVCNNQLVTCNHNVKTCFPCVQVLLVPKLTKDFAFLLVKWVPIRSVSQCKFHISTSSGFKWPWNGSNISPEMLVFIYQHTYHPKNLKIYTRNILLILLTLHMTYGNQNLTWGLPQYGTTLKSGTKRAISCCQLWSVDAGEMIKNGPQASTTKQRTLVLLFKYEQEKCTFKHMTSLTIFLSYVAQKCYRLHSFP